MVNEVKYNCGSVQETHNAHPSNFQIVMKDGCDTLFSPATYYYCIEYRLTVMYLIGLKVGGFVFLCYLNLSILQRKHERISGAAVTQTFLQNEENEKHTNDDVCMYYVYYRPREESKITRTSGELYVNRIKFQNESLEIRNQKFYPLLLYLVLYSYLQATTKQNLSRSLEIEFLCHLSV